MGVYKRGCVEYSTTGDIKQVFRTSSIPCEGTFEEGNIKNSNVRNIDQVFEEPVSFQAQISALSDDELIHLMERLDSYKNLLNDRQMAEFEKLMKKYHKGKYEALRRKLISFAEGVATSWISNFLPHP